MIGWLWALAGCGADRAEPAEPIRLWVGGDLHIGAPGAEDPLAPLREITRGEPGLVNLEGPLAEAGEPWAAGAGAVRLRNDPAILPLLARLGVQAAGIRNNHDGDVGSRAQTARLLGHAGIAAVDGLARLELAGGTLGVVSLDLPDRAGDPAREAELARLLVEASVWSGAQVASLHLTGPPSYLPAAGARAAAAAAIGAGAEVVVFHGSHAVGPVERRGGAVVLWGLGNVAFGCACTDQRDAILAELELLPGRAEARIWPIRAGLMDAARPAPDAGVLDLLEAVGSRGLIREGASARLE